MTIASFCRHQRAGHLLLGFIFGNGTLLMLLTCHILTLDATDHASLRERSSSGPGNRLRPTVTGSRQAQIAGMHGFCHGTCMLDHVEQPNRHPTDVDHPGK